MTKNTAQYKSNELNFETKRQVDQKTKTCKTKKSTIFPKWKKKHKNDHNELKLPFTIT